MYRRRQDALRFSEDASFIMCRTACKVIAPFRLISLATMSSSRGRKLVLLFNPWCTICLSLTLYHPLNKCYKCEQETAHKLSYRFFPLTRKLQDNVVMCCGKEEWESGRVGDWERPVCVLLTLRSLLCVCIHSFFFLSFLLSDLAPRRCWCVEWLSSIYSCLICVRVSEVSFIFPSPSCNILISITQSSTWSLHIYIST